jgi:hypothetical protein
MRDFDEWLESNGRSREEMAPKSPFAGVLCVQDTLGQGPVGIIASCCRRNSVIVLGTLQIATPEAADNK